MQEIIAADQPRMKTLHMLTIRLLMFYVDVKGVIFEIHFTPEIRDQNQKSLKIS